MTPELPNAEERITLDDIKSRVEHVRDLAVSEAKTSAHQVLEDNAVRTLLMVGGLVVVAASMAYFLGARAGRVPRPPAPPMPPI